jgi:hypothetical protein
VHRGQFCARLPKRKVGLLLSPDLHILWDLDCVVLLTRSVGVAREVFYERKSELRKQKVPLFYDLRFDLEGCGLLIPLGSFWFISKL